VLANIFSFDCEAQRAKLVYTMLGDGKLKPPKDVIAETLQSIFNSFEA
jgi:hypothetical protein